MDKLKVKIKKLDKNAVVPKYAKEGDAAMDLVAVSVQSINNGKQLKYDTGLAFEIPDGYVGLIYPRSSIVKTNLRLSNSTGIIDSKYRGPVSFIFDNIGSAENPNIYSVGDRIGQIMIVPYPMIEFEEVQELSETDRSVGGWGSTGR